jgi:octanoyl-[GcvH]:protein N-octanoyltransferase
LREMWTRPASGDARVSLASVPNASLSVEGGVVSTQNEPSLQDMTGRDIALIRASFPHPPTLDTAVSHAIVRRVSEGAQPETLRLHRPGPIVAFGPKDRLAPGYRAAIDAARDQGFGSVQRLAGGRAAVFHEQTIAFSWAIPDPDPRLRIQDRFQELAEIVRDALRGLGIDARIGEVPGEYCPGAHSVNARGRTKVMGVGQRIVLRAAHVGGVVVVGESERIRDVLLPVNVALGLEWDPATVGSLQDEVAGITWETAQDAIIQGFSATYDLIDTELTEGIIVLARTLEPRHVA